MEKGRYNTKQREEVLSFLQGMKGEHVTVNDICNHMTTAGLSVGMTTVYRHLEKMVKEGIVKKYVLDTSSAACFEYIDKSLDCKNEGCAHLKCTSCGRLIHLHCNDLMSTKRHILEEHGFKADMTRTVIYGLCDDCQ